jgi:hypothetical protein
MPCALRGLLSASKFVSTTGSLQRRKGLPVISVLLDPPSAALLVENLECNFLCSTVLGTTPYPILNLPKIHLNLPSFNIASLSFESLGVRRRGGGKKHLNSMH